MPESSETRDMAVRAEVKLVEIDKKIVGIEASISEMSAKLDRLLLERETERAERRGQLKVIGLVSAIFGALFGTLSPYITAAVKGLFIATH